MSEKTPEMLKADAEYDALPGTPPNSYSFITVRELYDRGHDVAISAAVDKHPESKHYRMTPIHNGIWLEFWDDRPFKEARFDPPYQRGE